jgi:hypothetical protein
MAENIFVGVLCVCAIGAAIWGWWLENGSSNDKAETEDILRNKKGDVHL